MRDYDPPATAAGRPQSLLVLKGEGDYQGNSADFEWWKTALRDHRDSRAILYPDLNQLFMTGEGRNHPSEYSNSGRVAQSALADMVL